MIGKLSKPAYSLTTIHGPIYGRVWVKSINQPPVTKGLERIRRYSPLSQQVQKVTVGSWNRPGSILLPVSQPAKKSGFYPQAKLEVASVKALGGCRPEDCASVVDSTLSTSMRSIEPQQPLNGLEGLKAPSLLAGLKAPSLVQAQQKIFLSLKEADAHRPGNKCHNIYLLENKYREYISKAMRVLMEIEKVIEITRKDLSVLDKHVSYKNTRNALHERYIITLVDMAKEEILELSKNLNDIFDKKNFYGREKLKVDAYQRTAKKIFSNVLDCTEKLLRRDEMPW